MKTSFSIGVATAGLICFQLLLFPASASRSTADPTSVDYEHFHQSVTPSTLREIKRFTNVRISMRDAVPLIQKRTRAQVIDISFDGQNDRLAYRIKAQRERKIWSGTIDASTGKLIGNATLTPVSHLDDKDKLHLAGLKLAGINLLDAVGLAEKYAGGKAVSAGLGEAEGKLTFLVVVIADGELKEVSIHSSKTQ